MQCTVCAEEKAAYKCPKCRGRYCSVACCAVHKLSCSTAVAGSNSYNQYELEQKSVENIPSHEYRLLTDQEKARLASSTDLRSRLKSKRLWADIIKIDSSNDRQAALKKMRAKPEFEEFLQILRSTVSDESDAKV